MTNRPVLQLVPPLAAPPVQRWGYTFWLNEFQCPVWDQPCDQMLGHGVPRIEFDSAPDCYGPNNINIQVTCENPLSHADWTWENVGIITETTPEKIFLWSMWLPQDPAPQTQDPPPNAWATLNQWHFGGVGSPPYCNWTTVYPCDESTGHATVDCNPWPVLATNQIPLTPRSLLFHTNSRNNQACSNVLTCGNAEPPRMWQAALPLGQWVDFAMYIKPDPTVGRIRFWVNGTEVAPPQDGSSFYQFLNPNRPFYFVKQGYYRERTIRDSGRGGAYVYMTPMLVTTPSGATGP